MHVRFPFLACVSLHIVVAVAATARAPRRHTWKGNEVCLAVIDVQAGVGRRIIEILLRRLVCMDGAMR
jgi:hypothetical protein